MRYGKMLAVIAILALAILVACAPQAAPTEQEAIPAPVQPAAKAGWEADWEKTLAEARKEGKVVVYSTTNAQVRDAVNKVFIKKYGIDLDLTVGRSTEIFQKVMTERRAGLFILDVHWTGATNPIMSLKPTGAFDPLRPVLILPEVTNPDVWFGKRLPFVDGEGKYVFLINGSLNLKKIVALGDKVKEGDLISYYDLLQPKWKGKIAFRPPSSGGGLQWFSSYLAAGKLDVDYMRQLAKQELLLSMDDRFLIESIVRGSRLLGIALGSEVIKTYSDAGVNLHELLLKEDIGITTSGGGGTIALMNKAPHPNAAKIFVNFVLSKEGQTLWTRGTDYQSMRNDTPTEHIPPHQLRPPDSEYFNNLSEEFLLKKDEYIKLAEEIFGLR